MGWLNFFVSGMQSAFGPIAAACLAAQGWTAKDIGFVLGVGGIASLVSQAPGGELLDAVKAKRLLVATGIVAVAVSVLIFYAWPSFLPVALAEALQGITGGVLGAGIVAITLGLVGHGGLSDQIGQNQRFAAAGGVAVTVTMASSHIQRRPGQCSCPSRLPLLRSLHSARFAPTRLISGVPPALTPPAPTVSSGRIVAQLSCRIAGC